MSDQTYHAGPKPSSAMPPFRRFGDWVKLTAALVGLSAVVASGVTSAVQYFATQQRLNTVDCRYHYSKTFLEAEIQRLGSILRSRDADAKIARLDGILNSLPAETDLEMEALEAELTAARVEKDGQESLLQDAKTQSSEAIGRLEECGHRGTANFSLDPDS